MSEDCSGSEAQPDLFALLPSDVAAHLLVCAGGPAALQATRATCKSWKLALDSLVTSASRSSLTDVANTSCAILQQLPKLHTVDLSSCCEPLPPDRLGDTLQQLSRVPQLQSLTLSLWCLALQPSSQQQLQQDMLTSLSSLTSTPLTHCLELPPEIGQLTQLQELSIVPCADISQPRADTLFMSPALMRLPQLTRLELRGFLPRVHHLRGLKYLKHLTLGVAGDRSCSLDTAAAGAAGDSSLQQSQAAAAAAMAVVCSISSLTCLQVFMAATAPAGAQSNASRSAGELVSLLSLPTAPQASEPASNCSSRGGSTDRTYGPAAAAAGSRSFPAAAAAADPQTAAAEQAAAIGSLAIAAAPRAVPLCRLQQLLLVNAGALYHLSDSFARGCLSGLQALDLSSTSLTLAAAAVLGSLTCLSSLQVAQAGLQGLPEVWTRLTGLQVLNAAGNALCVLPTWISQLQQLHTLVLSSTHLQDLPACISSLQHLLHLDLASNRLRELPVQLCACTGLVHLDLSKNWLLVLPKEITALSRITQLSLTGNHLESLPAGLQHLTCLRHLGLALNYYKAWVHASLCFPSLAHTLQELELQHSVTVMDQAAGFLAAVGQLTALTSLAAGSNQLSDLPPEWQQLKRLKVLQLSHNAMEALPIALLSLTALTYLDCSYNRLTSLPFWVGSSKLQQLKRLNLAKNHLTTLPAEMSGLSNLTQLQVQGNNLASLPPCLGALHGLQVLHLGCNYKLKEGGLAQELTGLPRLRDVVLPYRFEKTAQELRSAGKAVLLD